MKKYILPLIIAALAIFAAGTWPLVATSEVKAPLAPTLSHAQEVWLGALEWCESRGKQGAINPKDRDGTPSYGAFQFKPGTLTGYAAEFGITLTGTTTLTYTDQHAVVAQMVLHAKQIDWDQQFPVCVGKLGRPPAY